MLINARDLGWFLAGILSAIAVAVVLKPLLTKFSDRRQPGALLKPPLIVGALIVVLAIVLFVWLVSPSPPTGAGAGDGDVTAHAPAAAPGAGPPQAAGSMNELLMRLEKRLGAQGGTDADWELLAQTYDYMGRPEDAKGARAHHLPATLSSEPAGAPAAEPPPPPSAPASVSADSAKLEGSVELADTLRSKVPAGLTLFVVAKAVNAPGPPVAVMRTSTSQWPLRFSLDDANAMVPGRNLSTAGAVTVEARVSRSGTATPQPGDFQSIVVTVQLHERKSVRLLIDRVIG
jgi:hypothetical protein